MSHARTATALIATIFGFAAQIQAARAELPPSVRNGVTTACIPSGAKNVSAALAGSSTRDAQMLIDLERARRAKSKFGAAITQSNIDQGVMRCTYRGIAIGSYYDRDKNIIFLFLGDQGEGGFQAGPMDMRSGDIEESFHAHQITTRPDVKRDLPRLDPVGFYAMMRGLELEAKVAVGMVIFEMHGDPDAITLKKAMIFKHGKPVQFDQMIAQRLRELVAASANPSVDDKAFIQGALADVFENLLFADDVTYSSRLMGYAGEIDPKHADVTLKLDDLKKYFGDWPNGLKGLLDEFSPSRALGNAGESTREFIKQHRPSLVK